MMAEALRGTGVYAISDEIYRDLYFTEERPGSLSDYYERTLAIGGLSKSMSMTGWRLGWLCGEMEVVKAALILHGYVTTCASTVSQKAALAAWTHEAEAERERARNIFRERRDHLLSLIAGELGLKVIEPDGAFYAMMHVGDYGTSQEVAERLLEHRVITVPGGAFGRESEGFLRVSFCADLPALAEGVRRMARAFELYSSAGA
jgi:aspartate/methionine/tyrosine aminotransferase